MQFVSTAVPEPSKGSYIVDLANILDTDTEVEINMAIALLQKNKGKSIYLVTVPSITEPAIQQSFKVIPATSPSRRFLLLVTYYLLLITYSSATKFNF